MSGQVIAAVFLGFFVLAMGQSVVRRMRNPFLQSAYSDLPAELVDEIERIIPDFVPVTARATRNGDEVRIEGAGPQGEIFIEGEFDAKGQLIEIESDVPGGFRTTGVTKIQDLPPDVVHELERVLAVPLQDAYVRSVKTGIARGLDHYEIDATVDDWKWEVSIGVDGALHEFEKEKSKYRRS